MRQGSTELWDHFWVQYYHGAVRYEQGRSAVSCHVVERAGAGGRRRKRVAGAGRSGLREQRASRCPVGPRRARVAREAKPGGGSPREQVRGRASAGRRAQAPGQFALLTEARQAQRRVSFFRPSLLKHMRMVGDY